MKTNHKLYEVVYRPIKDKVFTIKIKAKSFSQANSIALEAQPLLSIECINEITN